jgi:hypothetical protein
MGKSPPGLGHHLAGRASSPQPVDKCLFFRAGKIFCQEDALPNAVARVLLFKGRDEIRCLLPRGLSGLSPRRVGKMGLVPTWQEDTWPTLPRAGIAFLAKLAMSVTEGAQQTSPVAPRDINRSKREADLERTSLATIVNRALAQYVAQR